MTIKVFGFYNKFNFIRKNIIYPKSLVINGCLRLSCPRNANIQIGENVRINSGWRANPAGGGTIRTLFHVGRNGHLSIGDNSGISNSTIVATKSVIIGKNVNIGVNCVIYDTDFHSTNYDERLKNSGIKHSSVVLEDGVWIGGHCIILKGVTIGAKSVIAAGSVVTKDIPKNQLWGGNPAKFIRILNEKS